MEQLRSKTEIQIQREIWETIWKKYPQARRLLFHVPNESTYNNSQQASSGVIPGVPDLMFAWDGVTYYIELKDDEGRVSDYQKTFHSKLATQGILVWVFYESAPCIDFLSDIIEGATSRDLYALFNEYISPYSDATKADYYLSEQQRRKQEARAKRLAKSKK